MCRCIFWFSREKFLNHCCGYSAVGKDLILCHLNLVARLKVGALRSKKGQIKRRVGTARSWSRVNSLKHAFEISFVPTISFFTPCD